MSEIQKPATHCTFFIIKQTLRRTKKHKILLEKSESKNCVRVKKKEERKKKKVSNSFVCARKEEEEKMEHKNTKNMCSWNFII